MLAKDSQLVPVMRTNIAMPKAISPSAPVSQGQTQAPKGGVTSAPTSTSQGAKKGG